MPQGLSYAAWTPDEGLCEPREGDEGRFADESADRTKINHIQQSGRKSDVVVPTMVPIVE